MESYLYDAGDDARKIAAEIGELKHAKKIIDERMKELTGMLVEAGTEAVDFIDERTGKHQYFTVQRKTTWKYSTDKIRIAYPLLYDTVTKTVVNSEQMTRLIKAGLIEPEQVGTPNIGEPYVGQIYDVEA